MSQPPIEENKLLNLTHDATNETYNRTRGAWNETQEAYNETNADTPIGRHPAEERPENWHRPREVPSEQRNVTAWAFVDRALVERTEGGDEISGPLTMHVYESFHQQDPMWMSFTGNHIGTIQMWRNSGNYSASPFCEDQLLAFENAHLQADHVDLYALFTGVDITLDRFGCAIAGEAGTLGSTLSTVQVALDHYEGNHPYQPENVRHLAALVAQETGHVWGEPEHVCTERSAGTWSIMCDNHQWDAKDFWLTSGSGGTSARRIMHATGYLQ